MSSSSDKFNVLQQNMRGDRRFCWFPAAKLCPSGWAPTWRLHTNLCKFGQNISPDISYMKHLSVLNLGEVLFIITSFHFLADSGLLPLNGFDFIFDQF